MNGPFNHLPRPTRREWGAVVALLAIQAGLMGSSAWIHSPSVDEIGHLPAGISHWQLGRFELYRVNPPLVRMVAALPLALASPEVDWSAFSEYPGARAEWGVGMMFLNANGPRSFLLFAIARWACIPFSLIGGLVCHRWARELYGPAAGLMALVLWVFCPNVLTFGAMITPDAGAASLGVLACYAFRRWLLRPDWPRAVLTGFALGLAELTKLTWIGLFPLWPLLWLLQRRDRGTWRRQLGPLALILATAVYTINLGYRFEGTGARLDSFRFVSITLGGHGVEAPGNRFAGTALGRIPVPLPANYVRGADIQKWDFDRKLPSYLRGEWRIGGWWYYYLYGLGVKTPLGTLALVGLALGLSVARPRLYARWRDEATLLAPSVLVLTLVSSQTGFNHHLRYVLPALPFLFIWASKTARSITLGSRRLAAVVVLCATATVASSLAVYPHTMSYFHELAGGPTNGAAHLADSNVDWGQDLLLLKAWQDRHPEAGPMRVAVYHPFLDQLCELAGIRTEGWPPSGPPPAPAPRRRSDEEYGPIPGWYAVGVTLPHYDSMPERAKDTIGLYPYLGYFAYFEPVARIGYSINIYHITSAQAESVRQRLGLRPLAL